jgi:alpha-N-arabinofuranosidase
VSLKVGLEGPTFSGRINGTVPLIDASAVRNGSELSVFLINRSVSKSAPVVIDPADLHIEGLKDAETLTGPGPHAANTWDAPDVIKARPFDGWAFRAGRASAKLPPLSVTASTFRCT